MTTARRIHQARSNNFGSIGANKVPHSGNVPTLRIAGSYIHYTDSPRKQIPIWESGHGKGAHWLVKEFPARRNEDCVFTLIMEGAGKALVFATFVDAGGVPQFLFVRRVGKGLYKVKVQIPFARLPQFRFGVANKLDSRIRTDHLSANEIKGITENMLLISGTKEMYTTEALNGFGNLGSTGEGGESEAHPGFVPGANRGGMRSASGKWALWDGSLNSHRWKTHGYSGKKEIGRPTAKGEASAEGPWYVADYTGYFAFRGSTYLMRYDEGGNMMGYDAVENLDRGMPAGVPICMVLQYFVHDPPGLAKGLGWVDEKVNQLGIVHKKDSWARRQGRKVVDTTVDTTRDVYEAGKEFYNDPSFSNAAKISTASLGMNSSWHYAGGSQFNSNDLFLVMDGMFTRGSSVDYPKDTKGLVTTYADGSAIPYKLNKSPNIRGSFKVGGKTYNKVDFGAKVEWYDPKMKRWSPPQVHPPFSLTANNKGKIKLIFRFPRQLDPAVDRQAIQEGLKAGYSDYSWTNPAIRTAYSYLAKNPTTKKYEKKYYLLGRVEGKDSNTEARITYEQVINGQSFTGARSLRFAMMIKPPHHSRAGTGQRPKGGYLSTIEAFRVHIADPAKFTYVDNPEIDHGYYVDGELKPGSVVIVLGKALGSVTDRNCILTTRGWANIADAERRAGEEEPPGDTPWYVHRKVVKPNNLEPRKVSDGSAAGTMRADYLEFVGHITADDLVDDKLVSGETVLLDTWKRIFGKDLDANWFNTTGKGLGNQDPNNPLHYIIKGDRGETYSFPYSIAWFKIPQYYVGPYLDYNDEGKLQTIEGKPYAIDDPNKQIFVIAATPFAKIMQQRLDIVAETTEQRELAEAGVEKDAILAVNELNFDAEDVTELVESNKRQREYLQRIDQTSSTGKPPKKYRYTNSWLKANFEFNNEDVVMKPKPVIAGFSNSADFYVEDVTEKWGALNGATSESDPYYDEMGLDAENRASESNDPYLSFGAFSGVGDVTDWEEFGKNIGKATGGGAGAFVASTVKAMDDAGLTTTQQIALGVGAFSVATVAGVALVYLGPTSIAKAARTIVTG